MLITNRNIKSNIPDIRPPKGLRLSIDINKINVDQVEASVRPNYYDSFRREISPPKTTTLKSYLEDDGYQEFEEGSLCPEMLVPEEIIGNMNLELEGKTREETSKAMVVMHAGRKDSIAPLHFDWDHDDILHVNMTGKKTFYFFPPEVGWLLMPIVNTSSLCVPRLSINDRSSLLKSLGGYEVTIGPGEAVLFPSVWWHSVLYDEASIGISVRFSDRADLRPFSVLPRSWWLQRLVSEIYRSEIQGEEVAGVLRSLSQTFFAEYPAWQDRYHAFNAQCREYLVNLGKHNGSNYWTGENFNAEIALAGFELEDLYTLPPAAKFNVKERLDKVKKYLFASLPAIGSTRLADKLAEYALATRNGLPPNRGLISIHRI